MSLLSNLVTAIAPAAKAPGAPSYRALLRETGRYRSQLDGYVPYAGNHEPPELTVTTVRGRIVAEQVIAVEAQRTAEVARLLERAGVRVSPDPDAWDTIGHWFAARVEGSREPGSDRYSPGRLRNGLELAPTQVEGESTTELRPLWRALAFDTALLLGQHMTAAYPDAAWTAEAALRARKFSVRGEPLVVRSDGTVLGQPFEEVRKFLLAALYARLGLMNEPPRPLGDALRRLTKTGDPANRSDPPTEFIDALDEFVSEYDALPSDADLAQLLAEHGLDVMPPLPPRLKALQEVHLTRS